MASRPRDTSNATEITDRAASNSNRLAIDFSICAAFKTRS